MTRKNTPPVLNLFSAAAEASAKADAPLALRLSPQTLDDIAGQEHILGEGKLLRRALEADRLTSAIFFGPPGCGKSAISRWIARKTQTAVEELNAVTAGVADVRAVIDRAKERRAMNQQKTLLVLDEIHRFNRSQQDALLPDVERGLITLIGLTTENPFFYVNSALLSRAQVFEFKPLSEAALGKVLDRALRDRENGLGGKVIDLDLDARAHFLHQANGDARRLLECARARGADDSGGCTQDRQHITLAVAEECVQKRALVHDKHGDQHYDIASAFIKSLRGGDPDAALYWMARLLAAGDDPRFVARRLIISASEDVGNADPRALLLAHAALAAVEFVGMPEGRIPLDQETVYIACAPKSNSSYVALGKAMDGSGAGTHARSPEPFERCESRWESARPRRRLSVSARFSRASRAANVLAQPDPAVHAGELGTEVEMSRRLESWKNKTKAPSEKISSKKETP